MVADPMLEQQQGALELAIGQVLRRRGRAVVEIRVERLDPGNASPAQPGQRGVHRDPVEPGLDGHVAAERRAVAIGRQVGILGDVCGERRVAADPQHGPVDRLVGPLVQPGEVLDLAAEHHVAPHPPPSVRTSR